MNTGFRGVFKTAKILEKTFRELKTLAEVSIPLDIVLSKLGGKCAIQSTLVWVYYTVGNEKSASKLSFTTYVFMISMSLKLGYL